MKQTIKITTNELQNLKNSELDLHIKILAQREREMLSEILYAIKEIDNRKLYLELSYGSLFAYLTEAVGYSAASAQRRIDAARLLSQIPSLTEKIERGEINLNQAAMIQKTAREIKRTRNINVSADEKLELLTSLSGLSQRETEKHVAEFFDIPVVKKPVERTQSDESVRLEITLTKTQFEKLKQAQALVSHSVPSNQVADFIEYVSDKVIKQKTAVSSKRTTNSLPPAEVESRHMYANKYALTKEVRKNSNSNSNSNSNKGFSTRIKKQVLNRISCCQFRDPKTLKICGSTWFLQIDHKHSKWAGGNNTIENAIVLCARHNHFKYIKEAQLKL